MKTKILSMIAGLLSATAVALPPPPPSYVPMVGLQGYWPFSGNANDIVGGNNGTVFGAALTQGQPNGGSLANDAYSFNGTSDYISVPWNGVQGTSARAVSFWAAVDVSANSAMEAIGWGDNTTTSTSQGGRFSICFNKPSSSFLPSSSLAFCIMGYNPSPPITSLVWHHYVYQIPSGALLNQLQIYEDGVLLTNPTTVQNSGITTVVNTLPGNNVLFGMLIQGSTPQGFFKGKLDDIGIWDRTLTLCEIKRLHLCNLLNCDSIVNPPASGCCLGNLCTDSQNNLIGNYEIPLNGFNFNFSGDVSDKVNVGYNCSAFGDGKFNSLTSVVTSAISGQESTSIYGQNLFNSNGTGTGVMGKARNMIGSTIGVWGHADGNGDNTGGNFYAGSIKGHNSYNVGVSAVALSSNGSPAPYTYKFTYPAGANIGIYATGDLNNTTPDNAGAGSDWAAWFDGDVQIIGSCWSNNTNWQFSDKRLKKDIKTIENANEKIKKLNGYTYSFRTDEFKHRGFDNKTHIGFIAQEIKEVFPELVKEDANGFNAVDYQGMIPVLLQAIKEQQIQAEKQQQQISELNELVQTLAGNPNKATSTTSLPVTLSDKNTIVLNQNVPNPFAESTVISYNIPADFTKAQIIFTTNQGAVIKAVNIVEKGLGSLTVFASDLSHGNYTYTLVVDGRTIATKKMIKE